MNKAYYQSKLTQIAPDEWYTITQITDNGFLMNRKGKPDRKMVARLVQDKILKSRNFGYGAKLPFYRVQGQSIIEHIKNRYL